MFSCVCCCLCACGQTWAGVLAVSTSVPLFRTLPDLLPSYEAEWRRWLSDPEPEGVPLPGVEKFLGPSVELAPVYKLLLLRSLRPDRLIPAMTACVRGLEFMTVPERQSAAIPLGACSLLVCSVLGRR